MLVDINCMHALYKHYNDAPESPDSFAGALHLRKCFCSYIQHITYCLRAWHATYRPYLDAYRWREGNLGTTELAAPC